jgi:hypothetical protein
MALGHGKPEEKKETYVNTENDQNGTPKGAPAGIHLRMSGVFARSRRAPEERTASKARNIVS